MTISSALKGSIFFVAGFVASQLLDSKLFHLGNVLPTTMTRGMTQQQQQIASSTSSISNDNTTTAAKTTTTALTTTTTIDTDPRHDHSLFDRIVQKAYQRAVLHDNSASNANPKRNIDFNIEYWENDSGLTTGGGLLRSDRILLAKIYGAAQSVFEVRLMKQ